MLASSSRNALNSARRTVSCSVNPLDKLALDTAARCPNSRHKRFASAQASSRAGADVRPYRYVPDHKFRGPRQVTSVAMSNRDLSKNVDFGRGPTVFRICKDMKESGCQPDGETYHHLLRACAMDALHDEAWAILEDMVAMGVKPTSPMFLSILDANRFQSSAVVWDLLRKMREVGVEPTSHIYGKILDRYIGGDNLEMSIQILNEMEHNGIPVPLEGVEGIIALAAAREHPRLAIDMAYHFEETSVRRLSSKVWVNCLIASAQHLYADGVMLCWYKVVNDLNIIPDEGLCIEVLHVAGRRALPDLATDVIQNLGKLGAELEEHHFAPLVEAFVGSNCIKDAMHTLTIIRNNGINPTMQTAEPISKAVAKDADAVDAAWAELDELHQDGQVVDISAINAVLRGAIIQGDLQRAFGIYHEATTSMGLIPDINTFDVLLEGCTYVSNRELGDQLIHKMRDLGLKPTVQTYQQIILLCLTQPTYEDAFAYLEEMKETSLLPPRIVYEAIVRTCVTRGDVRYKLAVEEMLECGYEVSERLRYFIDSGGKEQVAEKRRASRAEPKAAPEESQRVRGAEVIP